MVVRVVAQETTREDTDGDESSFHLVIKSTLFTRVHVCVCRKIFLPCVLFIQQKRPWREWCIYVSCRVEEQTQVYCCTWNLIWFCNQIYQLTVQTQYINCQLVHTESVKKEGEIPLPLVITNKMSTQKAAMSSSSPNSIPQSLLRPPSSANNVSPRLKSNVTATSSLPSYLPLSFPSWISCYGPIENNIMRRTIWTWAFQM